MTALKGKGKAAVKIGKQHGKLITDSRFYKPPKWKRKTCFRAIASAVRETAVCLHRSFATWRWVDEFLDGIVALTFRITNCRFPTRDCIPFVRSGLSQLVIRVKGFRVCALHCVRAITSIRIVFEVVLSAWTPRSLRVEFCIASARTTLVVSAVAPS